jgi:aminoglycoside phosphotransferase (APT) family kinase protein
VAEWDAERVVDKRLARRLVAAQCFTPRTVEPLGVGWDNTVWLVDGRWAFRFPRRELALPGVEREIDVLGELAPLLPLPIPAPRFVGEPCEDFPWPFFGAELIPGQELADAAPTGEERSALGRPLGAFLRALHDAPLLDLPEDPMRRADMTTRVPRTLALLREVEPLWSVPASLRSDVQDALRLPPVRASCIVHGDLHARHVLLHRGAISGVIDWGDVCLGDPSLDLALSWSALTPDGRADFFAAYGGRVSEETLLRARVLSVFLCAALAIYAANEGLDRLVREALGGLARSA